MVVTDKLVKFSTDKMNHNLSRPAGLSPYINTSSGDLLYVNLSNDVTFLMGSSISIIRGYSTDACRRIR